MVKEKESVTIEQINLTPIRKYQFITAKLVPFLIRMIMLKGSELGDILPEIRGLIMIAFTTISLAIWRYRKTA